MNLTGTLVNGLVISAVGLVLGLIFHGQLRAMKAQFAQVQTQFAHVNARFDGLEARLDKRIDAFQASLDAMRSDLTAVALAVGARPRTGQAGAG